MPVCTFISGYFIYEKYLYGTLLKTLSHIVKQYDDIEFIFYNLSDFGTLCFSAALQIKQFNPNKKITLTKVVNEIKTSCYTYDDPDFLFDKHIAAPKFSKPKRESDHTTIAKKIERWIIEHSDIAICYLYPNFFPTEMSFYQYAKKKGLAIWDITCAETKQFISESIKTLPEKKQMLLQRLKEGMPKKDIMQLMETTPSALNASIKYIGHMLSRKALTLYRNDLKSFGTCCVVALGKETPQNIINFKLLVRFLTRSPLHVREFRVDAAYYYSRYMNVLTNLRNDIYDDIKIIIVTHYNSLTEEDWNIIKKQYHGIYSVENYDTQAKPLYARSLRAIKTMLSKSDFCICNLEHPLANSISKHALKTKTTLLNICKKEAEVK